MLFIARFTYEYEAEEKRIQSSCCTLNFNYNNYLIDFLFITRKYYTTRSEYIVYNLNILYYIKHSQIIYCTISALTVLLEALNGCGIILY